MRPACRSFPGAARAAAAAILAVLTGCAALAGAGAAPACAQVTSVEQLHYPPQRRFEIPRPQRVVLDNGMVVMLIEDHELPLVTVSAMLRVGSRLDPPDKLGLSAIAADMLRTGGIARHPGAARGDGALSGDALDDELEAHAATLDVEIGEDSGSATLNALKGDFAGLLPLLAAVLRYPDFAGAKLDLAKEAARAHLARQDDDPDEVMWRELARLVYGPDSVYGRTPTAATLEAIGRRDLLEWQQRNLHPEHVVLGVVGDVRADEALAAIRAAFGGWPRGPAATATAATPATAAAPATPALAAFPYRHEPHPGLFAVDKEDMSQSDVAMGHLGVVKNDPDYFALQVLNELLAGSFGSRLVAHVRTEKALAYSVDGGIGSDWDHPGLAALSLSTKVGTTAEGIAALLAEARDLTAKPPTDDEVGRAKQSILASFTFHSDSPGKVLSQQLTFELFGYPLDWLERYRAGVEAVTTDAVRQAAARHLHPDAFTILVVGPGESRDPSLTQFGKVTPIALGSAAAAGAGGGPNR